LRSLDTNVLLRALLNDDPVQTPIAERLLAEPALISLTVTLETFWVLTSRARLPAAHAAAMFEMLLAIPRLTFADAGAVRWALERVAAGADFADMLHVATSAGADSFATFDHGIARHAANSPVQVETLG
jgi:predicted nucleic-acid-binding protein